MSSHLLHMDLNLARRIEMAEAEAAHACAKRARSLKPDGLIAFERIA